MAQGFHIKWWRGSAAERGGVDTSTLAVPLVWYETDTELTYFWDGTSWERGMGAVTADQVGVDKLGTPTYDNVQDWIDVTQSAGRISGGAITDAYPLINVALGTGFVKSVDAHAGDIKPFDWPNVNGLNPVPGHNWVYVDYNLGVPTVAVTNDWDAINRHTQFVIAELWDTGAAFHILEEAQNVYDGGSSRAHRNLEQVFGFKRGGDGLVLTESGAARTVDVSAGAMYRGLNRIPQAHIDTDPGGLAHTFVAFYRDGGGGWTEVPGESAISNSQWDDGDGGLADLGVGRYGVFWAYLDFDGHLHVQYGQGNYKLAQAETASVPETMPFLSSFSKLIARVIVLQGAATFYSVSFPWENGFTFADVADHGNLGGLIGNDHPFYQPMRYVSLLRDGETTEYADPDDAFDAADTAGDVILVPPGTWTLSAAHVVTLGVSVCGVGASPDECILSAAADVGAGTLLTIQGAYIRNVRVSYTSSGGVSDAIALYLDQSYAYNVVAEGITTVNAADGVGIKVYLSEIRQCYGTGTSGTGDAVGLLLQNNALCIGSEGYGVGTGSGNVYGIEVAATGVTIHRSSGEASGAGTQYGIYASVTGGAAFHSVFEGASSDVAIAAACTLGVYSCQYESVNDASRLGQIQGDRAGLARDETVTGAWTFNDDITMAAGKTVDGVDVGDHSARHDVAGADPLANVPDHDHTGDAGDGGQIAGTTALTDTLTHAHTVAAGDGGQLDWDTCWADAAHDHSAAGEGGQITRTAMAGQDTDVYYIFGRAYIGYNGAHVDFASWGHVDHRNGTGYSLLVSNAGALYINAPTGQIIRFRINNADEMYMNASGLRINNGLWVGGVGTAPDDNDVHIDGSINASTALGCRVYRNIAQSIPNNVATAIDWTHEIHDTDTCWALGANSDKLYAKHAGYYIAGAAIRWDANANTRRLALVVVLHDGSAKNLARNDLHTTQNAVGGMAVTTGMFLMNGSTDYVYFNTYQNNVGAGAINVRAATVANQHECSAWLVRVA